MTEPWEVLWDRAMIAIDSLAPAFRSGVDWSFGGGTAMRLFFNHRESHDIDIFVTDAYVVSGLSPRLNDATENLTTDYSEQSNFLKLRFPEGEVDFIIGGRISDEPFVSREIRGRVVQVETPLEIVAKKCFYRAETFNARDTFDLAVLIEREPESVRRHAGLLFGQDFALRRRFDVVAAPANADLPQRLRADQAREQLQEEIDALVATPDFVATKATAIETVLRFVSGDR